ncbi:MAG: 5-formyltetrahydrofolate cyclo-ligase [Pseudomonadota bacterium]
MNKSTIRQIYKQKRAELNAQQVREESKIIADNFIKNLLPKIANFSDQKLAFYIAANNEVDPIFILEHCQKLGNVIALPKIVPNQKVLEFKSYKIGDKLIANNIYTKILEPEESKPQIIPNIIFVPLIAFDKQLHRLGMGGGFYDATIKNLRQNSQPMFIGLGYDWQECPQIITENCDQNLDFLISENHILPANQ